MFVQTWNMSLNQKNKNKKLMAMSNAEYRYENLIYAVYYTWFTTSTGEKIMTMNNS